MTDTIQYSLVGLVVVAALAYVVRRVWRLLRGLGSGRCGGCCGCSPVPLVSLKLRPPGSPSAADATHRS